MIVGTMLLFTVQALGELAVLYPVNGAFYQYAVRFLDPAWYAYPKIFSYTCCSFLESCLTMELK